MSIPRRLEQLLLHCANVRPQAAAVSIAGVELSYQQVAERAESLAVALRRLGLPPGTPIGVRAPRGGSVIVAIEAVLMAGLSYVPVDPGYPAARQAYVARSAGIAALIETDPDGAYRIEAQLGWAASRDCPEDTAYIIFTSGSTGDPKGVLVSHRNVLSLLDASRELFHFTRGPWIQFHSYSFDFSVWEMFGAQAYEGVLHPVPEEAARRPDLLVDLLLAADGPIVLSQVPSNFARLVDALESRGWPDLGLQAVVLGGEAMTSRAAVRYLDHYAATSPLYNLYGITETTVHATCKEVTAAAADFSGPSPIGQTMRHLRAIVVRPDLSPCSVGEVGELVLSGDGVTLGYHRSPEQTRERFILVEDEAGIASRCYRTGDRVHFDEAGELYFHGRLDEQLALNGFRIEPGEVEAELTRHPGVESSAVVLARNRLGNDVLGAVYVPAPAASLTSAGELRRALAQRLPAHLIPSLLVSRPALPLTPSGKVDRAAVRREVERA